MLAWIWLEPAIATDGREDRFHIGKRAASHYFFTYELPKVDPQLGVLENRDRLLLDLDPDCL